MGTGRPMAKGSHGQCAGDNRSCPGTRQPGDTATKQGMRLSQPRRPGSGSCRAGSLAGPCRWVKNSDREEGAGSLVLSQAGDITTLGPTSWLTLGAAGATLSTGSLTAFHQHPGQRGTDHSPPLLLWGRSCPPCGAAPGRPEYPLGPHVRDEGGSRS